MLKIGDFSKLTQVSVKTLRYYSNLDLLKPAWIDRFTSYRYYSLDQLPRLNRILALKDLGFSLEQIRQLLREDLPMAELRGMMKLKQMELAQQLSMAQTQLARVATRLNQIDQLGQMPKYEVVLKNVPPCQVIGIRDIVPTYLDMDSLFEQLRTYVQEQGIPPDTVGPYMAIYYDETYQEADIDVEVAIPLIQGVSSTARIVSHELPGIETMACVIHQGETHLLAEAYSTVMTWIQGSGYDIIGPNREVYLQEQLSATGTLSPITEIQFPLKKKAINPYFIQFKEKDNMNPKIINKPAFTVIGLQYHGQNKNDEIAQMWQTFIPRMSEIEHKVAPQESYGICGEVDDEGAFKYVAGFEVDKTAPIPEGMVSWDVPEQQYAVFTCTLNTIEETYAYVFDTWLPQSTYKKADGPDFEFYDKTFDPQSAESALYVYIPVKS